MIHPTDKHTKHYKHMTVLAKQLILHNWDLENPWCWSEKYLHISYYWITWLPDNTFEVHCDRNKGPFN